MGQESGALYVRVGDTWHPVLNLASARLIAATDANPQPVRESELGRTKRGPLLGIPGAPQLLGHPLSADESTWTICDTDATAATTVVIGPVGGIARPSSGFRAGHPGRTRLGFAGLPALQRTAGSGGSRRPRGCACSAAGGPRAAAGLAVVAERRPRGAADHATTDSRRGRPGAGLPGFPVGSVLRITRGDGDEYYVVLAAGVQRIGQVAADLLRFSNSQGTANIIAVAPDAIRDAPGS